MHIRIVTKLIHVRPSLFSAQVFFVATKRNCWKRETSRLCVCVRVCVRRWTIAQQFSDDCDVTTGPVTSRLDHRRRGKRTKMSDRCFANGRQRLSALSSRWRATRLSRLSCRQTTAAHFGNRYTTSSVTH